MSYHYLIDIAIILLSTKVMGIFTRKIQMPQVVGALMAGLLLGPSMFGIVKDSSFIDQVAELGVIVLMFGAGLETNLKEMKKSGKASFIIALIGVLVPLAGGFAVAAYFNGGQLNGLDTNKLLQNIFIGVILTATSVSITVETLLEMGKLNTKSGTAILGAALIDDVLGIIILTIITAGSVETSAGLGIVLLKILLFFFLVGIGGIIFNFLFEKYSKMHNDVKRRFPIFGFVFCLVLSYIAEHYFGVADITGAYLAGIILSNTMHSQYISKRTEVMSYMLLSPIFFASIGIKASFDLSDRRVLLITVALVSVAVLTKIIGCGIGALMCRFSKKESLQIGIGMISRGEVALIVANKGTEAGLMNPLFIAPVIVMVVVTSIITPIMLKLSYKQKHKAKTEIDDTGLIA